MKLTKLLSQLEEKDVATKVEERTYPDGKRVIILEGKLPGFPFGDRQHTWYPLVLSAGEEEVAPETVAAILRRFWHGELELEE